MRRTIAMLACVCVPAVLPSVATGSSRAIAPASPLLWATIDACESSSVGEIVGVRASMPGTGDQTEQMFMRFSLQYRGSAGRWRKIGGSSALVGVGSAAYASRQGGLDFQLASGTAPGTPVRGLVTFEWRSGRSVVQSAQRSTTAGRRPSAGAHPRGFSAARCTVS